MYVKAASFWKSTTSLLKSLKTSNKNWQVDGTILHVSNQPLQDASDKKAGKRSSQSFSLGVTATFGSEYIIKMIEYLGCSV